MTDLSAFIANSVDAASSQTLEHLRFVASGESEGGEPDVAGRATLFGMTELVLDTLGKHGTVGEIDKHPDLDTDAALAFGMREATRYGLKRTPTDVFLSVVRYYRDELFALMTGHPREREFRHAVGRLFDRVQLGFWYGWEASRSSAGAPGPGPQSCGGICHWLPYPLVLLDREGRLIAATRAARDRLQLTGHLAPGDPASDEDLLAWLDSDLREFLGSGADEAAVTREIDPGAVDTSCRVRFRRVRDAGGEFAGAVVTLYTEPEPEPRTGRETAPQHGFTVPEVEGLVTWFVCAETGRLISVGESVGSVRGYDQATFLKNDDLWFETIHPDDRNLVSQALALAGEEGWAEVEYRVVLPGGDARWVRDRMHMSADAGGDPMYICGLTMDITDVKTAQHRNLMLQNAIASSTDAVAVVDPEGRAAHLSEGLLSMLGFTQDMLEQQGGLMMVHADQAAFRAALETVATGDTWTGQARLVGASARQIPMEMTARPIRDGQGRTCGMVVVYKAEESPVTDSTAHELAMSTTEEDSPQVEYEEPIGHLELLQQLVDNSPDMIFQMQVLPELSFEFVSPGATSVMGYTPDDHYCDPELWFKAVHPEDRDLLMSVFDPEFDFDQILSLRWVGADKRILYTEQKMRPLFDASTGVLSGIEGIVRSGPMRESGEPVPPEDKEPDEGEQCLDLDPDLERHLTEFIRVAYLAQKGIPPQAIAPATGMAARAVHEYIDILGRFRRLIAGESPTHEDEESEADDLQP